MARIPMIIVLGCMIAFSGCTRMWHNVYETQTEHTVSSSLMDYLYPNETPVTPPTARVHTNPTRIKKPATPGFWSTGYIPDKQTTSPDYAPSPSRSQAQRHITGDLPKLALPLTIGIAFIPTKGEIPGLSEARKAVLLQRLKQQMAQYRFIDHVQIIPEMYFRRGKGFDHVAKIGRRHHVDAIALVSYDQVVHMDDNNLSFLYLTVVGAYLVNGSQYDTQTFVDAAVVDVASKQILFRIPGVDDSLTNTTLMGSVREKRQARYQSFETAFDNMIQQVDSEVQYFKRRYSSGNTNNNGKPQDSSTDEAMTGAGATHSFVIGLLLLVAVYRRYGKPAQQYHQDDLS